jgi:uncharacterized protein YdeI (YjbR/CyaY-like superfamily)
LIVPADYPSLEISSALELREWLLANHQTAKGIWLVTYKKAAGNRHVAYDAIVREALCFGWIDGQSRPLDATRSQLLLTPRKPKSNWSGANKARITELTAAGLMYPAGQAMVDLAKRTGTWTALDAVEALVEPDEVRAALDANQDARRYWDAFPPSTRRAILEWIGSAKRPETLQKRIAETARLAAQNLRANQWPPSVPSRALEDCTGIEDAERVQGFLDRE